MSKEITGKTTLLTYPKAMEKLGIENRQTFYGLIDRGILKSAKVEIPGMRPKMREDVLDELINEYTLSPPEV